MENKCEKAGFKHSWRDTTPQMVYPTNPPQYPDRQETCNNCGLTRHYRSETKRWLEYSDGVERVEEPYWTVEGITIEMNDSTSHGLDCLTDVSGKKEKKPNPNLNQ